MVDGSLPCYELVAAFLQCTPGSDFSFIVLP